MEEAPVGAIPPPPEPPPPPPVRLIREGRLPRKEDYMTHLDDAKSYVVPSVRKKAGVVGHPALIAPRDQMKILRAELKKTKRLAGTLTVCLIVASLLIVILLAIVGILL